MDYPKILAEIKNQPGLFLSRFSVGHLKAFLDGYQHSLKFADEELLVLAEFQDFVVNKYKMNPTLSWDIIIDTYSNSGTNSFDNFFENFDEFLESKKYNES